MQIGIDSNTPLHQCSITEFDKLNNINNRGTLLCVRAISRAMLQQEALAIPSRNGNRLIGRGSIINLGSANSVVAVPGQIPYTAAKHAVIGITKTAALELGPQGVRVNAVLPSWVKTPMTDRELAKALSLADFIKKMVPMGRIAQPEEVADAIMFLAGPGSSYMNGASLLIDGGVTLGANIEA